MSGEIDYYQLMEGIIEIRESVQALTLGLMKDGFSEDQARDIVAGFFRATGRGDDA